LSLISLKPFASILIQPGLGRFLTIGMMPRPGPADPECFLLSQTFRTPYGRAGYHPLLVERLPRSVGAMLMKGAARHMHVGLPAVMDITAAGPLASEFLLHRGKDVTVDASGVERMGAQCLQVLLSAAATWSQDGMEFDIVKPSPAFTEALETAGLGMNHLRQGAVG
jgi:chemotaxis protein CheX